MEIVYVEEGQYLAHHGIKGQKWGVRRYQNPDGSLTIAGAKRYGVNKSSSNEKNDYDHSKSRLSKAASINTISLVKNVATLNPVGIALSAGRLAQKGVNAGIASVKTHKVEKANSQGGIDSKTGFHLKDKEYTTEEDVAAVNPGFKNFNENTKSNCMLCTMTYDLRKRGYAVTANKASSGYNQLDLIHWYPDAKVYGVKRQTSALKVGLNAITGIDKDYGKTAVEHIEKQGPGARGNVMVKFSNGGGHSMAYEIDNNGKMRILECQANKIYSNPEKVLSKCIDIQYARLDNIEPDAKYVKEIAH